jgi:MFS family permease
VTQSISPGRTPTNAMLVGGGATVVAVMPVFLTGAMSVQMADDLAFGVAGLGTAAGLFRMTQVGTSVFLGRLADRLGAVWSLRLSAIISATACAGIALSARTLLSLAIWLIYGSCANALGQPAANRLLIYRVPSERLGWAFGLKQSATPVASMLAGLAVPILALSVGWRYAFLVNSALALLVIVAVGKRVPGPSPSAGTTRVPKARLENRRMVVLFATALGLALMANASIPTFFVGSAVESGVAASTAGYLLAAGSFCAVVVRLIAGWWCDNRAGRPLGIAAWAIGIGSIGIGMLATADPRLMTAGVIIAMAGAWGFNGVFWFAMVRAYRRTPGRITGALAPGGFVGATSGTFVFGFVVVQSSYSVAWWFNTVIALIAATMMAVGSRRLERWEQQQAEDSPV